MDIVGFLYGFGLLQGLILALILVVARSGQRLANAFAAALVTVIALDLLQTWLIRADYFLQHPALGLAFEPLAFTWGPLLYLYAYTLTRGELRWYQLAHFLPAIIFLLAISPYWQFSFVEQRDFLAHLWSTRTDQDLANRIWERLPPFWRAWVDLHIQGSVFALQFGAYCLLVLKQIRKHNQRLERHYSSLERMNLRWLRTLTLVCLAFLLIFLAFNRSQVFLVGHYDLKAVAASIPELFLVLVIYIIAAGAIFQPRVVLGRDTSGLNQGTDTATPSDSREAAYDPPEPASKQTDDDGEPEKYKRSRLSLKDAESIKLKLMQAMQEDELYLDSELTLPDLARQAGLKVHQVSQVINGQLNENFFSFVNRYRIQLAKDMLMDPKTRDMPIVELALEVGFKSKSSFYDAFRKATQQTPTQFKRN